MPHQDLPPSRPTAAWISRYAAGLLAATPGMHPLDAVRQAMDASGGAGAARSRGASPQGGDTRGAALVRG